MTVDDIIRIINGTGFPIVAYGALFYVMVTTMAKNAETVQEALDKTTDAIHELSKLVSILISHEEKGEA